MSKVNRTTSYPYTRVSFVPSCSWLKRSWEAVSSVGVQNAPILFTTGWESYWLNTLAHVAAEDVAHDNACPLAGQLLTQCLPLYNLLVF